jgi:environmental stress-induced protein Ves
VPVVRAADAAVMPWRNGGGVTREYLVHPGTDGFEWRVSVAEVASDGPFSEFAGYERVLTLLGGAGMALGLEDGASVVLDRPLQHHRFPGEAAVHATLLGGPTTDLNLFWRRDLWEATVQVVQAPCRLHGGKPTLAYVAAGAVRLGDVQLEAGDLLVADGSLDAEGEADLVVFELRPVRAASR